MAVYFEKAVSLFHPHQGCILRAALLGQCSVAERALGKVPRLRNDLFRSPEDNAPPHSEKNNGCYSLNILTIERVLCIQLRVFTSLHWTVLKRGKPKKNQRRKSARSKSNPRSQRLLAQFPVVSVHLMWRSFAISGVQVVVHSLAEPTFASFSSFSSLNIPGSSHLCCPGSISEP